MATLRSAGPDLVEVVIAPLINELAGLPEAACSFSTTTTWSRRPVHARSRFCFATSRGLQLAVASRADPPLPLGALRRPATWSRSVRPTCFSEDEAAELLNGSLGLGLDAAMSGRCRRAPRAGPPGLELAALSVARQGTGAPAWIAAGEAADRRLPARGPRGAAGGLREFLLRTSILERFCASLCDAVTGGERHRAARACRALQPVPRCRSTREASGTATTTSSRSCCGTARTSSPDLAPSFTAAPRPGTASTARRGGDRARDRGG